MGSAGVGTSGAGGTVQVVWLDWATAITSSAGVAAATAVGTSVGITVGISVGGGEPSLGCSAGEGHSVGAAAAAASGVAATIFGWTAFLGLGCGTLAAFFNFGGDADSGGGTGGAGSARVTTVSIAGSLAAVFSSAAFSALGKGSVTGAGAGRMAMRTSRVLGTSVRRSCQGRLKPGSPRPWPLKASVNSSAWNSSESSSPKVSRLRSGLMPRSTSKVTPRPRPRPCCLCCARHPRGF